MKGGRRARKPLLARAQRRAGAAEPAGSKRACAGASAGSAREAAVGMGDLYGAYATGGG